ncbi:hint module domain-containing protein [Ditylenchus destructor]|nr:hint module domain-containing protein [Ditylenchus destructor]
MFALIIVMHMIGTGFCSFCGESAIPFSFEALPNGQPILGCARPQCVGWTSSRPVFQRIDSRTIFHKSEQMMQPGRENVVCSPSFNETSCKSSIEWVGGIEPVMNATQTMLLKCCSYEPLALSKAKGITNVRSGGSVQGGEIWTGIGKRQFSFEYITNIVKLVDKDGSISYDIHLRRFPCLPPPREFLVTVDKNVTSNLIQQILVSRMINVSKKSRAFQQAPTPDPAPPQQQAANAPQQAANAPQQVANAPQQAANAPQQASAAQAPPPASQNQQPVAFGPNDFVIEPAPNSFAQSASNFGASQPSGGSQSFSSLSSAYGRGSYAAGSGYRGGGGGYRGNGFGAGAFCFTGDSTVLTSNGVVKTMGELKIGDWVLSSNSEKLVYSQVESWSHRLPNIVTDFLKIELSDGSTLKITAKHYLYKISSCSNGKANSPAAFNRLFKKFVSADNVEVGDCLYVLPNANERKFYQREVINISTVRERGIFAPMTNNGDIVVNNVLVSCYAAMESKIMQKTLVETFLALRKLSFVQLLFPVDINEVGFPSLFSILFEVLEHILPHPALLYK